MTALTAPGTRRDEVKALARSGLFVLRERQLVLPGALHHRRQPVDHDIQKTADERAEHQRRSQERPALLRQKFQQERTYTTAPSLKIGKYIATTMVPITIPKKTIMIGSIRDDSAATASSTSRS